MALQLPAAAIAVSWRDESDSLAMTRLHARPLAAATLIAATNSLVGALQAASSCSATGYSISYPYYVGSSPASGSQLGATCGLFVFRCTGADQYAVVTVPGISATLIETSAPYTAINMAHATVQSFAAAIISMGVCNPFGHAIVALEAAFLQILP